MSFIYKDKEIEKNIEECFEGLSHKRRIHTENVMKVASELAKVYGADSEKAIFAAKCHDFFRGKSIEEINSLISKYNLPERYLNNANLAHGKIAARFLESIGIDDKDIINSVSFHTTGRKDMSLLEKIVFIADAIEPGRDYPGVDEIRSMAFKDIDKACLMSLEVTIEHLVKTGVPNEEIDKDTIEAAEFLALSEKES